MTRTAPSRRPGMGAIPYRDGTTFRVWAPHAEAVFVTGTFDDWAGDRDGARAATATARPARGRRTSRAWSPAPSTASRSARATATCRASTRTPARSPTRSATASSTTRPAFDWGDDDVPDAVLGRPGHLRDARRHVRGVGRPRAARSTTPAAGCATSSIWACPPSRSCRRSSSRATSRGATTRPTCSPSSRRYGGPGRVQAVRPRRARARHRRHRRRRLQPPRAVGPRPLAVRRLGRGRRRRHLLLQRRPRRDAVGRDAPGLRPRRGPDVPARQRDDLARGVPLRRPALRHRPSTSGRVDGYPADPASSAAGRLVVPGLDQRRDPSAAAMEDHDRRGYAGRPLADRRRPPRAGPGSRRSGTPGSSIASGPRWSSPDDAERDMDAVVAGIVGAGRGAP